MKQKTILFILIAVLLISTATFFFFATGTPSLTGLTILGKEIPEEDCFELEDGKMACKIGEFQIEAGKVINNDFIYLSETEEKGDEN